MSVEKLPVFAFEDKESKTAIEMAGKCYKKMLELIKGCNEFVDDIANDNAEFKTGAKKAFEEFAVGLRQEFQDFIDTVSLDMEKFKETAVYEVLEKVPRAIDLSNIPEVDSIDNPTEQSPTAVKYNGEIYLLIEGEYQNG